MQAIVSQLPVPLADAAFYALPILLLILGVAVLWALAPRGGSARSGLSEKPQATPGVPDAVASQLKIMMGALREFLSASREYGGRLSTINDQLSRPLEREDINQIVRILIEDNKKLEKSTTDLERRLQDAQNTIAQLTSNLSEAREVGERDPLTSLWNQRHFNAELQRLIKQADSIQRPLSLLLLDVDNFKGVNDTYGHLIGDEVLTTLGAVIQGALRTGDVAARYGGDEFAIILPNASVVNAKMVAERILSLLRLKDWKFADLNVSPSITISIGAAALGENDSPKKLFERADASLFHSKKSGKDRVSLDLSRKSAAQLETLPS